MTCISSIDQKSTGLIFISVLFKEYMNALQSGQFTLSSPESVGIYEMIDAIQVRLVASIVATTLRGTPWTMIHCFDLGWKIVDRDDKKESHQPFLRHKIKK